MAGCGLLLWHVSWKISCIALKVRGIMVVCRESQPPARHWHLPCDVSRRTPPGSTKTEIMEQSLLGDTMDKKQKGFSLIELLIVVAIILIIAAIAIPNLLRARMAANEASAVGTMRTITTAEVTYSTTYGTGFGTLASLGGAAATCATATGATSAAACLVDASVAGGTKSGYTIAIPVPAALGT